MSETRIIIAAVVACVLIGVVSCYISNRLIDRAIYAERARAIEANVAKYYVTLDGSTPVVCYSYLTDAELGTRFIDGQIRAKSNRAGILEVNKMPSMPLLEVTPAPVHGKAEFIPEPKG